MRQVRAVLTGFIRTGDDGHQARLIPAETRPPDSALTDRTIERFPRRSSELGRGGGLARRFCGRERATIAWRDCRATECNCCCTRANVMHPRHTHCEAHAAELALGLLGGAGELNGGSIRKRRT
jgi:hypothetical protein